MQANKAKYGQNCILGPNKGIDQTKLEQILTSYLANLSCELGPIMARYDFL